MKNLIATLMMFLMFVMTLSAQKQYSKEEKKLIGIIQQHYNHLKNKDFDKLADMWVHEPYVVHRWSNPDYITDNYGWNEVSTAMKNIMNTQRQEERDYWHNDYTFLIKDNMAMSNFTELNSIRNSIVFEKVKGNWKFVQLIQVDTALYGLKSNVAKLANFEGKWQLIPGSFKWENSDRKGDITQYEMSVSRTLAGLDIREKYSYINAQQDIFNIIEDVTIIPNSVSYEIIFTSSTSWPNGWTMNLNGKAKVTGESITLEGKEVGNEKNTYTGMINKESSDKINISWTMPTGEKWSVDLKLAGSESLTL